MSPVSTADVAIVGGGVIGAACARAAAGRGLHIAVFEPGPDPAAASPATAGMLAAQIEPTDELLLGLGVRSRDYYEALAAALKDTTGIDIGFWRGGIASVALKETEVDQLREHVALQRRPACRCRATCTSAGPARPRNASGPSSLPRTAPSIPRP